MTDTQETPPSHERIASLRGAQAASVGRRFWLRAATVGLVIFAVAIALSFASTLNDHARLDRMKSNGVPVSVTISNCVGNMGGSGSNVAGYVCRGTYTLGGAKYNEIISSMTTFASPGSHVRAIADPSQHGYVALASAIKNATSSAAAFVVLIILAVVFVVLVALLLRMRRRVTTDDDVAQS
jgi:cobalamin biosynthesis Mg chelatase CobN